MPAPRVAFVGMTHLGLCSAVAAAAKGFSTIGFARDAALINRLDRSVLPVSEPELDRVLCDNRARLTFTSDPRRLEECDLIYVAPDVPTDERGESDLKPIDELLELAATVVRPDSSVVVLSQVPPGFTRSRLRRGLNLYYQVETLIFGRAVERALQPERFIIGCRNPARPLPSAMRAYLEAFHCPILPMRFESAELAKIAINCCLVSSISVANTLAEICEGLGAVWSEIVPALKLDRRIGPHAYLTPGLGIAGGNLERDLATVCRAAGKIGSDDSVVQAWLSNSRHRRDWPLRTLERAVPQRPGGRCLAVLGLAYKENTDSIKNSPALALIDRLPDDRIFSHDPVVSSLPVSHPRLRHVANPLDCVRDADAVLIMTPWAEYRALDPARLVSAMRGNVMIDPFAVLDRAACHAAGLAVYSLGRPAPDLAVVED